MIRFLSKTLKVLGALALLLIEHVLSLVGALPFIAVGVAAFVEGKKAHHIEWMAAGVLIFVAVAYLLGNYTAWLTVAGLIITVILFVFGIFFV